MARSRAKPEKEKQYSTAETIEDVYVAVATELTKLRICCAMLTLHVVILPDP